MSGTTAQEIAVTQDRARHYRRSGWWPGEPLRDRYRGTVSARPDALAVSDDSGSQLSHAELWREAESLAEEFHAHGVRAGDLVLIVLPNRVEWQCVLLATLQMGAIPANIPVRTAEDMLAYVMQLCGVRLVVTCERHGNTDTSAIAAGAANACEKPPGVAVYGAGRSRRWLRDPSIERAIPPHPGALDHVMFTSSTTGRPKAVMHTADTLAALHITFAERFGLTAESPIFMPSPLGHSVGAIHGARLCLYTGAPLILQDRWDPSAALTAVETHQCAFTAAATPFLKDLVDTDCEHANAKLSSLRWFLCGGAQVPSALMQRAQIEFPHTNVTVLWGMTEGGLTTCVSDSPREKINKTAGTALPGLELTTLAPDGAPTPSDVEGELAMRGPGVFVGYMAQEDLYRSLLTPEGYFRTGDLAVLDADGYVRITGRVKDLIIRGGVNLSPVPIEDVLSAHPGVHAVAVVGYPDERLGERICAVVVPTGNAPVDHDALVAFARDSGLPKSSWPELVRIIDEFPRTAAGKIRKIDLRETIVARDRAAGPSEVR